MVRGAAEPGRDGVGDYTDLLEDALRAHGVDVVPVMYRGPVATVRRIRAARPDVVHVQFAPSAFRFSPLPGLLPDAVGAPVVTTLHEYGWWAAPRRVPDRVWRPLERRRWWDRETWRLAPRSAALVTTNAGHAGTLERRLARRAVEIPLAPNVVPVPGVGDARERLGVPPGATVVAFFGFVHPVKGLRHLVDALATLRAEGRDLHLLVLGGFTSLALPEPEARAFRAELEGRIAADGVTPHVTITGHLPPPDVSAALAASDLAAFPFTAGATTKSGALLSAFAHGLPTLVTAADPPDPLLVDGDTVVVAPRVRDATSLAEGLRRLLDDESLRERVAKGGAALAADRTWPRIAQAHADLYARVAR